VALASRKIFDLRQKQAPLLAEIIEKQSSLEKITRELAEKETQWQEQQNNLTATENDLQNKRTELESLRADRAKLETTGLLLQEQLRNNAQNITRLTAAIESAGKSVESARQRGMTIGQEIATNAQTLENKRKAFKLTAGTQQEIESRYKTANAELQALQDERYEVYRRQAEQSARFNSLKENISQREKELLNVAEQIEAQTNNQATLTAAINELKGKLNVLNAQRDQAEKAFQQELSNQQSLSEKESQVRDELRVSEAGLDKLNNQIQFYSSIIHSKEGFAPGLQYILDHPDEFSGIRGALSDLLSVDSKYYLAVEAVIKDISRLLIAENRSAALQTLENLSRLGKGRVSVIPLDGKFRSSSPTLKTPSGVRPLLDFIKSEASLNDLKEMLFRNVCCCADEQFENLINDPELEQFSIVSDRGRFRDANGFFSGGAEKSAANVLVGRSDRLDELRKELTEAVAKNSGLVERLKAVQVEIRQNSESRDKYNHDRQQIETEIRKLGDVLRSTESRQFQSVGVINMLSAQKVTLATAIANFNERLQKETPAQTGADEQLARLDQNLSEKRAELNQMKSALDEHNNLMQNVRVELINLENKTRNLHDEDQALERNIKNNLEQIENARAELTAEQTAKTNLEDGLSANQQLFTESTATVEKAETEHNQIRQKFHDLRQRQEALNTVLFGLRHAKEQTGEELKQLELTNSQFSASQNEIRSVLMEKYNQPLIEEMPPDLPAEADARQAVERYKHNLEMIGMVNMAVKEEYDQEFTRWKFLNDQREDLVSSEKGLTEVIAQIDQIAREQYLDIFNKIRSNFQSTFAVFFGGGEADLRLIGAEDPLEAEIDIWACPGGKKMRSLRMLSAGEKALTAITLLFAIYQVKPSPFCILDEVDAPLDDENIRRFANVIRTFSENTQFIIVTHNKSTMAIADALYGVTMAEKGISQIVSVKLE